MSAYYRTEYGELTPPSFPACAAAVGLWSLALRVCGFGPSLRVLNALTRRESLNAKFDPAVISEISRRVSTAAAMSPFRALCLEQSFALCYLLRRRAVAARLRLGVQAYPFAAHAWVEYRGMPINELGEVLEGVVSLPDVL